MNAQTGIRLSVAIAHHGILRRCFAASTYTGSGFGAGGAGVGGAGVRAGGPDAAGVAAGAAAGVVVAGAFEAGAAPLGASAASPWPIAERRSRDRFRRCSGISVTFEMIDGRRDNPGICGPIDRDALTHNLARPQDLRARLRTFGAGDYSSLANVPTRR
jgi:hypothetical protein